jgi:hypothetical protein
VSANVGDLIGHDGTDWVLADADGRIPAQFMAMESVGVGTELQVCRAGILTDTDAPYTAGVEQYLTATAGAHGAAPALSSTLTLLQRIGKALSTSELSFDLSRRGPDTLRARVVYDPASLGAAAARSDTMTVAGLLTTDVIRGVHVAAITGTGWDSGLVIQGFDVSGANTLRTRLVNATAGALDGASANLDVYVERW